MNSVVDSVEQIISANFAEVNGRIADVAGGRSIDLVCVTKYIDASKAELLVKAGAAHLGENRIIEGAEKLRNICEGGLQVQRHMIGQVQGNKASKIPGSFDWCQSVSRAKVADVLNRCASEKNVGLSVTIEVNIGGEPQKDGLFPEEVSGLVEYMLQNSKALDIRGLMCIPPVAEDGTIREYFSRMRQLFEKIGTEFRGQCTKWDTLSMGMSADFEDAIREGATMVRVGSALYRGLIL